MTQDNLKPTRFVVLPSAIDAKGKTNTVIIEPRFLTDSGHRTEDCKWFDPKGLNLRVGHLYDIGVSEDGTKFGIKRATWAGAFDDPRVLGWQAREKATDALRAAKARERKEASDSSALEVALDPIRKARSAVPYPARLAFDLWVLNYIRKE